MVMDQLPRSRFSLIEVRDAMIDVGLMAAHCKLSTLDTDFISHIPNDLNPLIVQRNLPA